MNERPSAVIIDHDLDAQTVLEVVLEHAGFRHHSTETAACGILTVAELNPLITIINLAAPGVERLDAVRRIRSTSDTYIVLLTECADEAEVIRGFDAGADEVLCTPFRPRELRARIEALLRRTRGLAPMSVPYLTSYNTEDEPAWLEHRGLRLSPAQRRVECAGGEIELTRSEFDLLYALMRSGKRVCLKDELAKRLHNDVSPSTYVSVHDKRSIEVHMANLRKKIGESPSAPRWIETVRGVGYRLTGQAVSSEVDWAQSA